MKIPRRTFLAGTAATAALATLPKTSQATQNTEPVKEEKAKQDVHKAKQNTKPAKKSNRQTQKKQKISGIGGKTLTILGVGGGVGFTASAIAMPILTGASHTKENS